jgi:hypothetical protein
MLLFYQAFPEKLGGHQKKYCGSLYPIQAKVRPEKAAGRTTK